MQVVLEVAQLPDGALEAAAVFYTEHLPKVSEALAKDGVDAVAITLPLANHAHNDWRRALAHDLAREYAPRRVNLVSGEDVAELLAFLAKAPGVTGQCLVAHG